MNEKYEANPFDVLSLDDLSMSEVSVDELRSEETLGIPELGASVSYYGCCSYQSSL
jgi:hypothetical protein